MNHENIKIIEGKSPILLSGPHVVPIIMQDENGKEYRKPPESRVRRIIKNMCREKNTWGIFTHSQNGPLQKWDEHLAKEYRKRIRHIIEQNNISLFLDLHGAQAERPFVIDYDFKIKNKHEHDKLVETALRDHFTKHFSEQELSCEFFQRLNGPGRKTFTYYVRKRFGIPAVQLELNRGHRMDDENFKKLLDIIHSLVHTYENTALGVQSKKI